MALRSGLATACLAVALASSAGCVDSFGGSNLQLDFSGSTPLPGGNNPDGPRPPADTYLAFYAVDNVYKLDASGKPMLDGAGHKIVDHAHLYEVSRFEIKPVIDQTSPCFIEDEHSQFPGLHVTQFATKLKESICTRLGLPATCFDNPFTPPSGATSGDVTDVLDANRRMSNLNSLENTVEAVTSYSVFTYPAAQTSCAFTGDQLPAPSCTDDASNAQRLRVCRQLWASDSNFYEGSDKVFTLPLSGHLWGIVEGHNPINGGLLGGSSQFVDMVLSGFNGFAINWQYKDHNGDGQPDYPPNFTPAHQKSDVGYPFVVGEPEPRTRGVISAHLVSPYDPSIVVDMSAFAGLADDNVHF